MYSRPSIPRYSETERGCFPLDPIPVKNLVKMEIKLIPSLELESLEDSTEEAGLGLGSG